MHSFSKQTLFMTVRTRFAPSPTGYLHVGGARTALFSWLYARKHGGDFVLRIEDTDLERSNQESVNAILEGMTWLGLEYDEGPFYQTHRFDRYKEVIDQLLKEDKAYYCYCSKEELDELREGQRARKEKPRYDGRCRHIEKPREGVQPVIRFRNPTEGAVSFEDGVKGTITIQNSELDDLVIARPDGTPTYNLTVVVDDLDMGINHVIRGDDHINNTPRQINIIEALGEKPPIYSHVPMILGDDGARLSKRHGAVSVMQYRDDGFLPEALLNYLVRLSWSHGDQEIFSVDEMVSLFDIVDVNRSASAFNTEKLIWLNQHYLKTSDPEHVARHLSWHFGQLDIDPSVGPDVLEVIKVQRDRCSTLVEMAKESAFFYRDYEEFDEKAAKKNLRPVVREPLEKLKEAFAVLPEWDRASLSATVEAVAESLELKMGKVGQPLRVAVAGQGSSPAIDDTLFLVGREAVLRRIDKALDYIAKREAA